MVQNYPSLVGGGGGGGGGGSQEGSVARGKLNQVAALERFSDYTVQSPPQGHGILRGADNYCSHPICQKDRDQPTLTNTPEAG